MEAKHAVAAKVADMSPKLRGISHELYAHPELAYEEFHASRILADAIEAGGLTVERGAHGLETAFRATAGSAGTHFVICAEYDALPEIGHACGHNIIAASALGAGLALASVADDLGFKVTILGTPAEEGGGGKIDLIEAGAFEGVDAALMVHPGPVEICDLPTLAWSHVEVTFHGKESHASAAPHRGLNALDAMTISYTAIGALRQHIQSTERIHGIFTHGGDAPNIVPKMARARYYIRARTFEELDQLKQRVFRCFEAGALATGCSVEITPKGHDYDTVAMNPTMGELYEANLVGLGRSSLPRAMLEATAGSTDMGNVSRIVPSIHPLMAIDSLPAVNHQAEFAAATVTPSGDKAIVDAATAMAQTVVDLVTTPGAMNKVAEEFASPPPVSGPAF